MQCEEAQEDEWNKAVFKWGAFDQTRNPFANKPPSLSHAENCIATAHAQCVSTQTFPLRSARCCIAQSCELLADEVLTQAILIEDAKTPRRNAQKMYSPNAKVHIAHVAQARFYHRDIHTIPGTATNSPSIDFLNTIRSLLDRYRIPYKSASPLLPFIPCSTASNW